MVCLLTIWPYLLSLHSFSAALVQDTTTECPITSAHDSQSLAPVTIELTIKEDCGRITTALLDSVESGYVDDHV